MVKYLYCLAILGMFCFTSCDSDDDLTELPYLESNVFLYDVDQKVTVNKLFQIGESIKNSNGTYTKRLAIAYDFDTADNVDLATVQFLIEFQIVSHNDAIITTGKYVLDHDVNAGAINMRYTTNFNSGSFANYKSLKQGDIRITNIIGGFEIDVRARDINGRIFEGVYRGNLNSLP